MSKRRFSDIAITAFRSHKHRHLQGRGSCRLHHNFGSVSHSDVEDGVRQDVFTMATGAAGPPVDDLISRTVSIDPFWQSGAASHYNDSASSPSAYLSVALPSPSAGSTLSQTLASASSHWDQLIGESRKPSQPDSIFFLRSDADSLHSPVAHLAQHDKQSRPPIASTSKAEPATSDHAAAMPSSDLSQHTTWMPAQSLTQSPTQALDGAGSVPPASARPGRPTLARLNTSEMLRSRTSTALPAGPARPNATRKSPTALKLQLDTSVPRRSATLSSYPHGHRSRLHAPVSLSPSSSARVLASAHTANPSTAGLPAASDVAATASSSGDRNMETGLATTTDGYADGDFQVSTILPDFLYLGSDVQSERDAAELQAMGVRRILNVACEIDEDGPMKLRDRFERYLKVPMLDHVEAKGVQGSIEQACSFLDDARLRCAPVYVHCKAGKSRSVTIVIAYLIHALGWTLRRSYSHVVERRAGICPNIGFISELMRFEERTLKLARSTGIHGDAMDESNSKPSASLLPPWNQGKSHDESSALESAPSTSTPVLAQCDDLTDRTSSASSRLGGALSQSSPDLSSLTSSRT